MRTKRGQAVVLAMAAVAGYSGAATYAAWAEPGIAIATDFGPDDGLTRYVLTADSGDATSDLLAALEATDGVVNAQRLFNGRALVATESLVPHQLEAVPGVADAEPSPTGTVLADLTDPLVPTYGWNLENTGTNAYRQAALADADV